MFEKANEMFVDTGGVEEAVGFSLGGGLTEHVGAKYQVPARVYNAGLGPEAIGRAMSKTGPPSLDIIRVKGDRVSIASKLIKIANPNVKIREIAPLKTNDTDNPIKRSLLRHMGDNFHVQDQPRAEFSEESKYSKVAHSAHRLREIQMVDEAVTGLKQRVPMNKRTFLKNNSSINQERVEKIWDIARNTVPFENESEGYSTQLRVPPRGRRLRIQRTPPSKTQETAEEKNANEDIELEIANYADRLAAGSSANEQQEFSMPKGPNQESFMNRMKTHMKIFRINQLRNRKPTNRANSSIIDEYGEADGLLSKNAFSNNEIEMSSFKNDWAVGMGAPRVKSGPIADDHFALARRLGEEYANPGEKYAEAYANQKELLTSPDELNKIAKTPDESRSSYVNKAREDYNTHEKNFANEVDSTSPAGEFGMNILSGLGLGEATNWAVKKIDPHGGRFGQESLGATIASGLGTGISALAGAPAAMLAPEAGIGIVAGVAGSEIGNATTKGLESILPKGVPKGVSEGIGQTVGGTSGGGFGGGALIGAGKLLNKGAGESSSLLEGGGEATAEAAADVGADAALETAGTLAAAATADAGVGAGVGSFFAPETFGGSVALGAFAGTLIGGISFGLHKLFGGSDEKKKKKVLTVPSSKDILTNNPNVQKFNSKSFNPATFLYEPTDYDHK